MLTGLKKLIKKNIKYLKALFIFSILIFVVYEVGHIFKQIDWSKVQTGLAHQSLMTIGHCPLFTREIFASLYHQKWLDC